jgi:hypothetical protein
MDTDEGAGREAPKAPDSRPRQRDVASAAGRLAGRWATGLGGALLRNRTVRSTIRRAQEEARGDLPPAKDPPTGGRS